MIMKAIEELTEQEILALKEQDVVQMIKFKMASEGIKLLEPPVKAELHTIPPMDNTMYVCSLLGGHLAFADVDELQTILQDIRDSRLAVSLSSDYFNSDSADTHCMSKFRNVGYSSDEWDAVNTVKAYSNMLYQEVKTAIEQNKKIETNYQKEFDDYTKSQDGVSDIQNEIWDRVREVKDKFSTLDHYTRLFKDEYMPLADNDEKVAMNFLKKAYTITEEGEAYILNNSK